MLTGAQEYLREGNLHDSLAQLQHAVRDDPANSKLRIFLFQMLTLQGDWNRAQTQLDVLSNLDARTLAMVHTYRDAVRCEPIRADVFAGRRAPLLFGRPTEWIGYLVEALRLGAAGHIEQSRELGRKAFDAAPAVSGRIDDRAFQWIADADSRIGPVMEAVIHGNYFWIPFEHIRSVQFDKPSDLRDAVWTAASFTWSNDGEAVGLVPTRYVGSEKSDDGQIRLARKSVWVERGPEFFVGLGQRMFATDIGEFPIMDVRRIDLNLPDVTPVEQ